MVDFHELERNVLPHLRVEGTVEELQEATGMDRVEVVRALQWLSNKEIVETEQDTSLVAELTDTGKDYVEDGLPEQRLMERLESGPVSIEDLDSAEEKASIGELKKAGLATIDKGKLVRQDDGDFSDRSEFLQSLPRVVERDEEVKTLEKRGIIDVNHKKTHRYTVSEKGEQYLGNAESIKADLTVGSGEPTNAAGKAKFERVTHEMLKNKDWEGHSFRAYDVESDVPLKDRGKRHFVEEAKEYVRDVWTEFGFEQMTGDIVQSAFWNLDTLFVPQDHPARDMQDTFYVDGEGRIDLEAVYERVEDVHESGGDTASTGWRYDYSEEAARKLMLRTHTTVLSAKTLAELNGEELPRKFFSLGRNYRNESLDWKHLFEFYQVEGIVVDPDATFANLIGYLKAFFKKMGFPDARVRPGYFPYTEPSAEVDVYHPGQDEWVELGGAGVFRPEVTKPLLGFECPVLAWGLGLERIITDYYGIEDLRRVYANDVEDLRTMKKFIR